MNHTCIEKMSELVIEKNLIKNTGVGGMGDQQEGQGRSRRAWGPAGGPGEQHEGQERCKRAGGTSRRAGGGVGGPGEQQEGQGRSRRSWGTAGGPGKE